MFPFLQRNTQCYGKQHKILGEIALIRVYIYIMNKQIIHTPKAPAPIGPYSQAVLLNDTLYISGQVCIDAETGGLEKRQRAGRSPAGNAQPESDSGSGGMSFAMW
jgi:hypothetical protein